MRPNIYKNIHKLYEVFTSIENDFNNHVDIISSKDNIKARQVNIDSLSAEDIYDALGCEALDEE